jgi:hypothetical protein
MRTVKVQTGLRRRQSRPACYRLPHGMPAWNRPPLCSPVCRFTARDGRSKFCETPGAKSGTPKSQASSLGVFPPRHKSSPLSSVSAAHIEFYPDDRVSDPAYSSEYTHTGYQWGHMATSATIGIYIGSAAQAETFRLRNVVPQLCWNNEGIWNTLERIECDNYPKRYGVTESVCGPVLGSQRMGRIPVPRKMGRKFHPAISTRS